MGYRDDKMGQVACSFFFINIICIVFYMYNITDYIFLVCCLRFFGIVWCIGKRIGKDI